MKVKIVQNKEIRIWKYPSYNKYQSLLSFVCTTFDLFDPSSFSLQYQDDEDDIINITSDIDITDAIICAEQESSKSLKISVKSKPKRKHTNPETYSLQYMFINMIPNNKHNDVIKPISIFHSPKQLEQYLEMKWQQSKTIGTVVRDEHNDNSNDILKNIVDKYQKLFMSINNNVCAWSYAQLAQEYSLGKGEISQMKNAMNENKISNEISVFNECICTSVAINTPTMFIFCPKILLNFESYNNKIFAGENGSNVKWLPLNNPYQMRQYLYDSAQQNNFIYNELSQLTQSNKDIFIKDTNKKEDNITILSLTTSVRSSVKMPVWLVFINDEKYLNKQINKISQIEYNPDWNNCIYYIKVL